ncbi:MAG: DNA polymerase IV [Bacillota bacterium]|nr:DNA polymerase IV [Bacillota bacterium]
MDIKKLNIIHMDMDAFYASVEERDNPSLKGKPMVVGGRSNRGIVTTANYEARKYGIHSAMPIFMAKSLCPQLITVPVRHDRYRQISRQIFSILYCLTDQVEKISIDEAFLDIKDLDQDPRQVCSYIRDRVWTDFALTMSFGISYNKFLAKIASDYRKPQGLTIISPEMMPDFLYPFPLSKVYGIGPKSQEKFANIGVNTVKDLMALDQDFLIKILGKSGRDVYQRIRGIDKRPVEPNSKRKSLGTERTFQPTRNEKYLKNLLKTYAQEISQDLKKKKIQGKTVIVKLKYDDFTVHTRSKTMDTYSNDPEQIYNLALDLFQDLALDRQVRLLGLTVANLLEDHIVQMCFL